MTTTATTETTHEHRRRWRLGPLGAALEGHLHRLQSGYLRNVPVARAQLARLRRGLGKPAGSVPEIWDLTIAIVPQSLRWDRDEPSHAEEAAHAVLTLFALHQQSLTVTAHVPGVTFGRAVGLLRHDSTRSEDAVTRRFMAAATGESISEVLTHVRGLITQLRSAGWGIDYARFADDLTGLLNPARAQTVRLAWGRDFYRSTPEVTDIETTAPDDTSH